MAVSLEAIFESKGITDFLSKIDLKLKKRPAEMKKLGTVLKAKVFADIISHFEQEEGPDGPWTAWSQSYDAFMKSIGKGGNKILQDSGRLRQSITPAQGLNRAINGGVLFYTDAKTRSGFPYAAAHDTGGPILPQRKFMYLGQDGMDAIAEATLNWLTDVN